MTFKHPDAYTNSAELLIPPDPNNVLRPNSLSAVSCNLLGGSPTDSRARLTDVHVRSFSTAEIGNQPAWICGHPSSTNSFRSTRRTQITRVLLELHSGFTRELLVMTPVGKCPSDAPRSGV